MVWFSWENSWRSRRDLLRSTRSAATRIARTFIQGTEKTIERLNPTKILVYGEKMRKELMKIDNKLFEFYFYSRRTNMKSKNVCYRYNHVGLAQLGSLDLD